jgi:hypothetical protein
MYDSNSSSFKATIKESRYTKQQSGKHFHTSISPSVVKISKWSNRFGVISHLSIQNSGFQTGCLRCISGVPRIFGNWFAADEHITKTND